MFGCVLKGILSLFTIVKCEISFIYTLSMQNFASPLLILFQPFRAGAK